MNNKIIYKMVFIKNFNKIAKKFVFLPKRYREKRQKTIKNENVRGKG